MYKEHPDFKSPQNEDAKIWRYMDFSKLVCLIDKSALFFARADKLGDPFEGSFSKANIKLSPIVYKDKIPQEEIIKFRKIYIYRLRQFLVINSWYLNEYESAAMWNRYLKSNEGIAIQTSFKNLKNSLIDNRYNIYIGKVRYIDYEKDWLPEGNVFYPFLHKRKSFEYEQELRAIIAELGKSTDMKNKTPFDDGIYVNVDLNMLIQNVYVAPTCPPWLTELIKSISNKYGLDKPVIQSELDKKPIY
jgi:hypothetical protein